MRSSLEARPRVVAAQPITIAGEWHSAPSGRYGLNGGDGHEYVVATRGIDVDVQTEIEDPAVFGMPVPFASGAATLAQTSLCQSAASRTPCR
jgi:hypothetical protein